MESRPPSMIWPDWGHDVIATLDYLSHQDDDLPQSPASISRRSTINRRSAINRRSTVGRPAPFFSVFPTSIATTMGFPPPGEDAEGAEAAAKAQKELQDMDLEAAKAKAELEHEEKEKQQHNPNLVSWDGPDDPANPKNWSIKTKWFVTFVVSGFTFISPVSSSMVAPALGAMARDLGITSEIAVQMTLSIFVLAYAIGPLAFGPLSESFGRVRILMVSNLFYMVWNLCCGFANSEAEMIVFRFLAGIGGSAPLAIGGGVLSDCWHPDQRGLAVGIYSLAPLLGPVVGPVAGGFIAEYTTWRWVFWSTTIAAGFIQVAGYFWLAESHAPTLLRRKKAKLIKETGNDQLRTPFDTDQTLFRNLMASVARPSVMLATQPLVQIIALYMAYLFGLFYLVLSTFPEVWATVYGERVGIGGLNYIALGLGFIIGAQINARASDKVYIHLKKKNGGTSRPEFRVPSMFVGSVLIPIGFFWYGWSVQTHQYWLMPDVGIAIFAAGAIVCLQCMQAYIIDSYSHFAASGLAAAVVLRSLAGFGFPLFAPYMYQALQYGWGNSLLGFISIVVGIPAPFLFWSYGPKLRAMSKYATA